MTTDAYCSFTAASAQNANRSEKLYETLRSEQQRQEILQILFSSNLWGKQNPQYNFIYYYWSEITLNHAAQSIFIITVPILQHEFLENLQRFSYWISLPFKGKTAGFQLTLNKWWILSAGRDKGFLLFLFSIADWASAIAHLSIGWGKLFWTRSLKNRKTTTKQQTNETEFVT